MKYFYTESECILLPKTTVPKYKFIELNEDDELLTQSGKIIKPFLKVGCDNINICGQEVCFCGKHRSFYKTLFIEGVLFIIGDTVCASVGQSVIEVNLESDIVYESTENFNGYKFIYFSGDRNFVAILKDNTIEHIGYYDVQKMENQRVFILKLYDELNHGLVFGVKNSRFSKYLIYLDNLELKLNNEFVPFVFLDCVLAGNFKYAKKLLLNFDLDEKDIGEFFPRFDRYIIFDNLNFILINKNTLAGICKIEQEEDKISNIILL